jgi:hypothetical protein
MTSEETDTIRKEVLARLGNLEGKIDLLLTTSKMHSDVCDADRIKINNELMALEKRQSWMMGIGSAIVFVGGAIIALIKGGGHS